MTRNFNHSVPRSLALSAHPDKQASMEPEEAKKAGEFAEIDSSIASMTINSEWFIQLFNTFHSADLPPHQIDHTSVASLKVQENFIKIQEAYELLSDATKRKQYDFDEMHQQETKHIVSIR